LLVFAFAGAASVQAPARLLAEAPQSSRAALKPATATSPDIPSGDSEWQTEQQLLILANQSRRKVGVQPLTLDSGLSAAARTHAQAMLEAHKLSHQFDGEPGLPHRLAATTSLQLDQEGENVALDYSAQGGHDHLMLSPPHRANLLNPAYNVIGLGVMRSGDRLYIVQDFGHALPTYSPADVKDRVAAVVNRTRRDAGKPSLQRNDLISADEAACSMAHADKLGTAPVRKLAERSTVLTYTSLRPDALPAQSAHAITSGNLHTFSVGACYARTESYPTGVYWIVLSLD
jgi:uncharacterized protein YkwD